MWDLPRRRLEPMSPALAGRFLTTVHQGSPECLLLNRLFYCHIAQIYPHYFFLWPLWVSPAVSQILCHPLSWDSSLVLLKCILVLFNFFQKRYVRTVLSLCMYEMSSFHFHTWLIVCLHIEFYAQNIFSQLFESITSLLSCLLFYFFFSWIIPLLHCLIFHLE